MEASEHHYFSANSARTTLCETDTATVRRKPNARYKIWFNILLCGAVMKKTAYAKIPVLALLFSAEAQVVMVMANLYWPFPDSGYPDWGYPEITVTSPVQNGTYPQNNVWLNLTVTKPSNWTDFEGQLKYIAYLIDGNRSNFIINDYYGETRIPVEDPLGVVNPPLEFNFSVKLEGLSEGNHHVDVAAEGLVKYNESNVSVGSGYGDTINFIVTKESSAFPTALAAAVSGASATIIGLGVLLYFKKRKR
jgi:hypothetical protein